ncbi:hypothetical protein [Mycolicibacterium wolinskyi]|uniref:hypothetical protein n=1 Tax=Mycolicibacterium wolinskyi TaxID=59750 RepID=UPI003917713A
MITQPTDLPVPPGGEPDLWIGGQRDVYREVGTIPLTNDLLLNPCVTVLAEQRQDGTLGCIDVLIDVDVLHNGLSATQARELAALLNSGADLADTWAGNTPNTDSRLAAAKNAVFEAYNALRLVPGNAGDYLRAALDSIADAIEVTR